MNSLKIPRPTIGQQLHGAGRIYDLSAAGAVSADRDTGTLDRVARRARTIETPTQLGPLLDRFAATSPNRRRRIDADPEELIGAVLARAAEGAAVNLLLVAAWAVTGAGFPWFGFPLLGWGIDLVAHRSKCLPVRPSRRHRPRAEERRLQRVPMD